MFTPMFMNITELDGRFVVETTHLKKEDWDEYCERHIDYGKGEFIFHEIMFTDPNNAGARIIETIANGAGGDESPSTSLRHLLEKVFMMGASHGARLERDRIIGRLTELE